MSSSSHISRRQILGGIALAGGQFLMPPLAISQAQPKTLELAWKLGWKSAPEQGFKSFNLSPVSGRVPDGLSGRLFRNGPALFERGRKRVDHWFDGDGMVQSFHLNGQKLHHKGVYVKTTKYLEEKKAGRYLVSGFGTSIGGDSSISGPDDVNVANTSVIEIGGSLYALWEGGSAYEIDTETLATGPTKEWGEGLKGLPFSAHPKTDVDGTIWNFGQGVSGHNLVIYHISKSGSLITAGLVNDVPPGMIHDFCITDKHLVFVATSLRASRQSDTYLGRFEYEPQTPQRIIILDKGDLTARKDYEIPAGFQFHFGNAYSSKDGSLHFSACSGDDTFITKNARKLVRGNLPEKAGVKFIKYQITPNGKVIEEVQLSNLADCEFPQFDQRKIGQDYRFLYMTAKTGSKRPVGNAIVKYDMSLGKSDIFNFGDDYLVEEHLFIPKSTSSDEDDGWLIGTALNIKRALTGLYIFNAKSVSDGPICIFELPYASPLGFHGYWKNA